MTVLLVVVGLVVVRLLDLTGSSRAPPWSWSIDWSVLFRFAAIPTAVAEFDETSPPEPGLSTRIDWFDEGFTWTAVAVASASCLFEASCPAICVDSEP